MGDELAKAITKIVYPALKPDGFHRARKRDLIRVENGISQLLCLQVSGWGGREFCVNVAVNLIAANEFVSLLPGFRLARDESGGDLWLPSKTKEEAEQSADVILEVVRTTALPYFEKARTIQGYYELLSGERWASSHHLNFERGVAATLCSDEATAQRHLAEAIRIYKEDGRDWCANYIDRAAQLQHALATGNAMRLLREWELANSKAYGLA
jgi:hypothetical protein